MKYSDEHIKKLIDGMLPALNKQSFQLKKNASGELENIAVIHDHNANIRELIKKANSEKEMINRLAKYTRKHGHKPQNK